jgi:hypothetical protein
MSKPRGYIRSFEPVQIALGAPVLVTISFECDEAEAREICALADSAMRANKSVELTPSAPLLKLGKRWTLAELMRTHPSDGVYWCGCANCTAVSPTIELTCKCVEVDAGGCVGWDVNNCPRHNPDSPTYVGRDGVNR